jgi:acyl phosphate:glycerol-3-phosphate acyltransferase
VIEHAHPHVLGSLACLAAYLAGSVPFGLLIARAKGVDIRDHGSGNIGATNVWRVLGKGPGLTCFVLDFLKGLLPTIAFGMLVAQPAALRESPLNHTIILWWLAVAACAILGHMFPVWLKFKGGKGVATSFGALVGVFPVLSIAALGALIVWLISAKLTRMVGVSSCLAALAMPILVLFELPAARALKIALAHTGAAPDASTVAWPYLTISTLLAALVIYKHRANIARTIAGTETKIGGDRAKPAHPKPPH